MKEVIHTSNAPAAIGPYSQAIKAGGAIYVSGQLHVGRVDVFMKDINMFADMNAVYAEFFTEKCPARAAVEVARLPKDALVEIGAIAVVD